MSRTSDRPTNVAARDFFTVQSLLSRRPLAHLYTDLLVHSPTTIRAVRERTDVEHSTAYKYADELARLGIAGETDDHVDGAALWRATPVVGTWTGDGTLEVSPTAVAVYGASDRDDNLDLFCDRHGADALFSATEETLAFLRGEQTRRGVAERLGVPATEGIAVSQVIEAVVAVVAPVDPTLDAERLTAETHDRVVADSPYLPPTDG